MLLTIDIPDDVVPHMGLDPKADVVRSVLEKLALASYADGSLSRYQIQRLLGFDNRWETEDWLGSRGAVMRYTVTDLETDRRNLDRVLNGGVSR